MQKDHKIRTYVTVVLILILTFFLGNNAYSQNKSILPINPELQDIRAELLKAVSSGKYPSFQIAVIQNNKILWKESMGYYDTGNKKKATSNIPYELASLGKSITALATMTLVEKGLIDLSAPANQYLGASKIKVYQGDESEVTVRRLLDMTAGVPHGNLKFYDREVAMNYSMDDFIENEGMAILQEEVIHYYSNFSIALLEAIIENVSKQSFAVYVQQNVFTPLNMTDSFIDDYKNEGQERAKKYNKDGSVGGFYQIPISSHAIYCSLEDLIKYSQFHLKNVKGKSRIISNKNLDLMHTLKPAIPQSIFALGLGSIELDEDNHWLLTNGQAVGVQSTISMVTKEDIVVICLTNITGSNTDGIAIQVTENLYPEFSKTFQAKYAAYQEWAFKEFVVSDDLAGAWKGEIQTPNGGLPISMTFKDDQDVHVSLKGQYPTLVNQVRFEEGFIKGSFLGHIKLHEQSDDYHRIDLNLVLSKKYGLSGTILAVFKNENGEFSLPAYISLTKE